MSGQARVLRLHGGFVLSLSSLPTLEGGGGAGTRTGHVLGLFWPTTTVL